MIAEWPRPAAVVDALQASIERAQRRSATLRAAILERAFSGELVPQDPTDEPAEALLARIRKKQAGIATKCPRRYDALSINHQSLMQRQR